MCNEVDITIYQAHDGLCGVHFNSKYDYQNLFKLGYNWHIIIKYCEIHIRKHEKCQNNAKLQPYPSHELHSIVST